jgi:glycosyltransferase involved in cell wall biosynthesis
MARVADLGARHAWLWRNKDRFAGTSDGNQVRLLVDVSAIIRHDAQTGIQRVVRAVWSELTKHSGGGFVARPVYATNRQGYCYAPSDFLERRPRRLDAEPVGLSAGDTFLGLDLSAHLLPKYRQQIRRWRANGGSVRVVVYDLLPLQRPEWFSDAAGNHFRKWIELLNSDIDNAICISDHVARELATNLGRRGPRISRLYMGADISASRPSIGLSVDVERASKRMRDHPTILMVGTVEPRKGYDVALDAFEYLWRTDPDNAANLVIVGKPGWKTSALQQRLLSHPMLDDRLLWLDRVSDEGLSLLYEAARGVLVTSRGEGFGLPLIEAASHGRHVLARDLPVFREQRLPNVSYFNDDSAPALARRLMDLLWAGPERTTVVDLLTWKESVDRFLVEIGLRERATGSLEFALCDA